MNILFLSISYSVKSKNLYNDLVECLIQHHHNVTVVSSKLEENEVPDSDRIKLVNVCAGNQFDKNLIKKGINMVLLEHKFKKAIRYNLSDERYDLILYATPPISLNGVVKYCKTKYNAKTFLMLKDIFPQNAVDLQMFKKDSIIYKYFKNKENKLYNISDYVGCMSNRNKEYVLANNNIDKNKVHIFYNSIKVSNIQKQTFNENHTVFVFGGNIGKPQNIKTLLLVIDNLKNYQNARFLIIGKGTEENLIKDFIYREKPNNLIYKNHLPREEYDKEVDNADVGLILLDPRFTIPNIPSKLLSYFNIKKPVLAITDRNTDLKDMIQENDCGWWCSADNIKEITNMIIKICEHKDDQKKKGLNGYKYLYEEFNIEKNVREIELFMKGENND